MSSPFSPGADRRSLILYSRRGCHLCEDFEQALRQLRPELDFEVIVRDVDDHPEWTAEYGDKVPLLLAQDGEVCRYFLDPQALRSHLGQGAV